MTLANCDQLEHEFATDKFFSLEVASNAFSYTWQSLIVPEALGCKVAVWTGLGTKSVVVTGRVNVVAAAVVV